MAKICEELLDNLKNKSFRSCRELIQAREELLQGLCLEVYNECGIHVRIPKFAELADDLKLVDEMSSHLDPLAFTFAAWSPQGAAPPQGIESLRSLSATSETS